MRDLASALISYAWAQTLFTVQQVVQLALSAPGLVTAARPSSELPVSYSPPAGPIPQSSPGTQAQQLGWGPMP